MSASTNVPEEKTLNELKAAHMELEGKVGSLLHDFQSKWGVIDFRLTVRRTKVASCGPEIPVGYKIEIIF